ncbi:MAG: alpha/beta hydrolase-fold protein, partial [Cyclobacteriaceae bacterium]
PEVEPRTQIWPNPVSRTTIMAKNMEDWDSDVPLTIDEMQDWVSTENWTLDNVPNGTYYIQVLWDQDTEGSRISAPGNIYSEKTEVVLDSDQTLDIELNSLTEPLAIAESPLAELVNFRSDVLSDWWEKDVYLKASILLPHNYEEGKPYTIRYNVAGYGGRYTRINYLLNSDQFMSWWTSDEAPEIISVFLDGEGPYGDSYQMDSENSGPYGTALINELIPYIENKYRGTSDPATRFIDGCSTGGWVSLGLQLYYPDVFGGVFSFSPDAIEFENYQLINIYKDENAYTNEFGYPRPVMRSILGEPMLALKDFIGYENVLSTTNTYVKSGGQFSAHTALYGPKGPDGLPKPLFDPKTGEIDHEVAEHWKKYDFKIHAEENWEELGPKLQGKVYIWMGDMDQFYLNTATRAFADFIETTENPQSDAVIEFEPMKGHCQGYDYGLTLHMIQEKMEQ